eukprot:CAMPEP_0115279672 /NCGR_PEP_ID=MMETSP0270-20121206/58384_1 /TAXON_ID=71861 /ORGANISM="Scrippsiella trochoidea, Strain CCMP3099" /LENGTH=714 /DNA_ID=CAMNT_0002696367 /DNA_START=159 /DNA_END=2303 /DNA_ORIENTATION=-
MISVLAVLPFALPLHDELRFEAAWLLFSLVQLMAAWGAAWLLSSATDSGYLSGVAAYATLNWATGWASTFVFCGTDHVAPLAWWAATFVGLTCCSAAFCCFMMLVQWRLTQLAHFLKGVSAASWSRCLIGAMLLLLVAWVPLALLDYGEQQMGQEGKWIVIAAAWVLISSFFTVLLCWVSLVLWSFGVAWRLATAMATHAHDREAAEARLAASAVRDQILGIVVSLTTTVSEVVFFLVVPRDYSMAYWLCVVSIALDKIGNTFAALWFAGAFTGSLRAVHDRTCIEAKLALRRERAAAAWQRHEDTRWHEKVCELATRGFTLEALLDFYEGLGQHYMLHWNASKHTTTDVVRHAIIPQSALSRSALATVMMHGNPTLPERMVTHCWSNLFRDLVAAVCADALGEAEYCRISFLLERDIQHVRQWLCQAGKLSATYWICAFSVNQHCTICSSNPDNRTDSVTSEPYPLCSCGLPKVCSSTEPVTGGFGSIDCEVNKFHDMMTLLAASCPKFGQVIAIDIEFRLFSRAWCVAELAAAHATGMAQTLKFSSARVLEKHQDQLRSLRIEDMQATCPEDKEKILSGIQDVAAFNQELQRLLFEDLVPAWRDLDAMEQMERLGHLARWEQVADQRQYIGLWQAGGSFVDPQHKADGKAFRMDFEEERQPQESQVVMACSATGSIPSDDDGEFVLAQVALVDPMAVSRTVAEQGGYRPSSM